MSFITRCPACGTSFRAQPEQLTARAGRVRCGHCGGIFDGLTHLVSQDPGMTTGEYPAVDLDIGEAETRSAPAPDATAHSGTRAQARTVSEPVAQAAPPSYDAEAAEPEIPFGPRKPRRSYSLLWGFFAFLALVALAAQFALHFRVEIAARYPELRVHFAALCEELGCAMRLPHRSDLMSIESSDLQADPRREGLIQFNAVLRNRAAVAQEYPSLEVTLTDERDRAVLRRVLEPGDYLDARQANELTLNGIAAGTEHSVRMYFDIGKLRATGYRVYLFYH